MLFFFVIKKINLKMELVNQIWPSQDKAIKLNLTLESDTNFYVDCICL